jgi:hypothetical protein
MLNFFVQKDWSIVTNESNKYGMREEGQDQLVLTQKTPATLINLGGRGVFLFSYKLRVFISF